MKKQKKNLLISLIASTLAISSIFAISLPLMTSCSSGKEEPSKTLVVEESGFYMENLKPNVKDLKIYSYFDIKTSSKTFRFANIPSSMISVFGFQGWTVFGKDVEAANYKGTVTSQYLDIPQTILVDGVEETIVNVSEFSENEFINSVEFHENIVTIFDSAFAGCINLKEAKFANAKNLAEIGEFSFNNCYELENVNFSNSKKLAIIGEGAFANCYKLACEISIHASITYIGSNAFGFCPITNIEMEDNDTYIFASKASVGNAKVVIENNQADADKNYDYKLPAVGCLATGQLSIGDKVTVVSTAIFENCYGLTGNLFISKNVASIEHLAFTNTNISSISIDSENSVFILASKASVGEACIVIKKASGLDFNYQSSVVEGGLAVGTLTIAEDTTTIRDNIFSDCSGLKGSLTIPSNVTEIGDGSFNGCYGLNSLDLSKASKLETIGSDAFGFCESLSGKIIIPSLVHSIGADAFRANIKISEVDFSNASALESIGRSAFNQCIGLTETVIIPANVHTIHVSAFSGCSNLTGLNLDNATSLRTISGLAFESCSSLKGNITIPATMEALDTQSLGVAFSDCILISSLTFKNDTPVSVVLTDLKQTIKNDNCKNIYVSNQTAKDAYITAFTNAGYTDQIAKISIKA